MRSSGEPGDEMPPDIELWYCPSGNALRSDPEYRLVASARGVWAAFVTLERIRHPAGGGTLRVSHWDGTTLDEVQAPYFLGGSVGAHSSSAGTGMRRRLTGSAASRSPSSV